METFALTTRSRKYRGMQRIDLVLEMRNAHGVLVRDWALHYAGPGAVPEHKSRLVLRLAERRGMLANAEKDEAIFNNFDGSAREMTDILFDRGYQVGRLVLDEDGGMRLALAFRLLGRCNKLSTSNAVESGLVNLAPEELLYWFTLCAYGQRQKAGRAALTALLTTK